ncbi:glycoside hydrolase family 13 protein [Sediminivirga luteola]|nr:glycoside hydrolase family 13 protein [Sediminivirga luteola]
MTAAPRWWSDAVIYQVYPRSFADGDGDGMGDLPGVIGRLDYLADLGVDAVWLSPFYVSPQKDAGYDVADYRDVDPMFGSLEDADRLIAEAHARHLKVIVDLVPNHTSDQHVWFQEALASPPGSPARERYIFRPGKGPGGEQPPNNWQSIFGGPAWTRIAGADDDETGGEWYLHLFDSSQPDLNWNNPEVHAEFEAILRFWLDRGVDGFRVDVAHGMVKAEGLPDWEGSVHMVGGEDEDRRAPFFDQEGVHEIYREWRRVLDEYEDRILVAEAWVHPLSRLFRYVRGDEMHQAFNFVFLSAGWDAAALHEAITDSLREAATVGATSTWVLSNHDTVRHASRFGLEFVPPHQRGIGPEDPQPDEALGLVRARAAALLELGLPGSAYVYQGDELGLPEHTTLAPEDRQDPAYFRTGGGEMGRDGCRVPLPWAAEEHAFGFGAGEDATPWLPQPERFRHYAVDRQSGDETSTLELYRTLLRLRAQHGFGRGEFAWHELNDPQEGFLAFTVTAESSDLQVLVNLGTQPVRVGPHEGTQVTSRRSALTDGHLVPDAAVWRITER